MDEDIPVWKKNKQAYNREYMRNNFRSIKFNLNYNTEQEYIDIWEQIPNKRQFFKEALLEYAKKNLR